MDCSRWEYKPAPGQNNSGPSDLRQRRKLRVVQGKVAVGSGTSSLSVPSTRPSSAEEDPVAAGIKPRGSAPLKRRVYCLTERSLAALQGSLDTSSQCVSQEVGATPRAPSLSPEAVDDLLNRSQLRTTGRKLVTGPFRPDELHSKLPTELYANNHRVGMNNGLDLRKSHAEQLVTQCLPDIQPTCASKTPYQSRQRRPVDRNESLRESALQEALVSARARVRMEQYTCHTTPRLAEYLESCPPLSSRSGSASTNNGPPLSSRSKKLGSKEVSTTAAAKKEAGDVGHVTYNPLEVLRNRRTSQKKGRDFTVWSFRQPNTAR